MVCFLCLPSPAGPRKWSLAACVQVKALDGSEWKLLDVITKTLRYVKEEALKETGRSLPHGLLAQDVRWVLTVPAIWADGAKGFMRKAAFQA